MSDNMPIVVPDTETYSCNDAQAMDLLDFFTETTLDILLHGMYTHVEHWRLTSQVV